MARFFPLMLLTSSWNLNLTYSKKTVPYSFDRKSLSHPVAVDLMYLVRTCSATQYCSLFMPKLLMLDLLKARSLLDAEHQPYGHALSLSGCFVAMKSERKMCIFSALAAVTVGEVAE